MIDTDNKQEALTPEISEKVQAMIIKQKIAIHKAGESLNSLLKERSERKSCIETGFPKFDKELDGGLYPGLYILGAISSMGKTAFMSQIADQIAASKTDVLFFSLEMGSKELVARSLSRYSYLIPGGEDRDAITARRVNSNYVLNSFQQLNFDRAVEMYRKDVAENLYYYESLGDIGVNEIREEVERHIKNLGAVPVVFIDYLQIMKPIDERWTEKRNIDKTVIELRKIARDHNVPIFAISSLNRGAYNGDMNLDAFKESGAIEYGSDVLLGLQVPNLDSGATPSEARSNKEAIEKAKREAVRRLEVKILKNRSGRTGERIEFDYTAKFNYFSDPVDDKMPSDIFKGMKAK